jgi:putative transposase
MSARKTEKGTKKFTKEEKLAILREALGISVKATQENFALYPATFCYWKKKFVDQSSDGMDNSSVQEKLKMFKELEK